MRLATIVSGLTYCWSEAGIPASAKGCLQIGSLQIRAPLGARFELDGHRAVELTVEDAPAGASSYALLLVEQRGEGELPIPGDLLARDGNIALYAIPTGVAFTVLDGEGHPHTVQIDRDGDVTVVERALWLQQEAATTKLAKLLGLAE